MAKMLNIREVREILGLSYVEVIRLIKEDKLPAYKFIGGPMSRRDLELDTKGLRFKDTDINEMLEESLIT